MFLSLERSPFIKHIAGASEKWKINVNAELKTFIFKIEGIDLLHSLIVASSLRVVTISNSSSDSRRRRAMYHHLNICIHEMLGHIKS